MFMKIWILFSLLTGITGIAFTTFDHQPPSLRAPLQPADTLLYPEEKHFRNLQQLTFGGDNAEAYFSYDGQWLVFQRTSVKDGLPCDQIFVGKIPAPGAPFQYKMISSGKGRTTCGFFT